MFGDWPPELVDLLNARGFVGKVHGANQMASLPDGSQTVVRHLNPKARKPWRHFVVSLNGSFGRSRSFATPAELRDHLLFGDFDL